MGYIAWIFLHFSIFAFLTVSSKDE
jgi:hypothetical protein